MKGPKKKMMTKSAMEVFTSLQIAMAKVIASQECETTIFT